MSNSGNIAIFVFPTRHIEPDIPDPPIISKYMQHWVSQKTLSTDKKSLGIVSRELVGQIVDIKIIAGSKELTG